MFMFYVFTYLAISALPLGTSKNHKCMVCNVWQGKMVRYGEVMYVRYGMVR